jgi:hypothetical protein
MLGWMILFALMALPGVAAAISGYPASVSVKTVSVVFTVLFLASLLTAMAREKAR